MIVMNPKLVRFDKCWLWNERIVAIWYESEPEGWYQVKVSYMVTDKEFTTYKTAFQTIEAADSAANNLVDAIMATFEEVDV